MLPGTDMGKLLCYPRVNTQDSITSYAFFLTYFSDMSFPVYSVSARYLCRAEQQYTWPNISFVCYGW